MIQDFTKIHLGPQSTLVILFPSISSTSTTHVTSLNASLTLSDGCLAITLISPREKAGRERLLYAGGRIRWESVRRLGAMRRCCGTPNEPGRLIAKTGVDGGIRGKQKSQSSQ